MKYYELNAYILSRRNVFEADKIVTMFSYEQGKCQGLAKGVRLSKSKLAGSLEPFNNCVVRLVKGRNLDIIIGVKPRHMQDYSKLSSSKLRALYFMSELLSRLSPEHQPNTRAFDLLTECIDSLFYDVNELLTAQYFGLNFLQSIGSHPELSDTQVGSRHYLVYDSGKVMLTKPNSHYGIISESTIKLWRLMLKCNLATLKNIKNIQEPLKEGQKLMLHYYEYHFDFQPKSLKVFQE